MERSYPYNAGIEGEDIDDRHSSSKTQYHHSSRDHRHSSHSKNKHGHHHHHRHSSHHNHRHSNHGHGHRHHQSHHNEMHKVSLNDGDVATPNPAPTNSAQRRRPEQHQHDANHHQRSSHRRPSSGLAHSTPPKATIMAQSNKQVFTKSAPPVAYSPKEQEDDEEQHINHQSSNAVDKAAALSIPVVAVQPCSPAPKSTTTTTTIVHPAPVSTTTTTTIVHPSEEEPRQGRKFCGCCCDFRRAVIIVNIIIIILEVFVLILVLTGFLGYYLYGGNTKANAVLTKYETAESIFSAVSIVLSGVAIGGAILFNIWMVGLNIIWIVLGFILGIVLGIQYCGDYCDYYESSGYYSSCTCILNFPAVSFAFGFMILWIYPHVGFIMEVRKGIMSRDTYAREQFSCCCV